MRFLAIILSVYVLALSCFSCADEIIVHTQTASIENHHDNSKEHSDEEMCPPFCNCACCKISVEINVIASLISSIKNIKIQPQVHFTPAIVDIQYAIWQPPQLS